MTFWQRGPKIPLGTRRFLWLGKRTVHITPQQAQAHMHVLGKTGSCKSYFLAGLFLAMHEEGMPATLIDTDGGLARMVLGDRRSTRVNIRHANTSHAVLRLKKKRTYTATG